MSSSEYNRRYLNKFYARYPHLSPEAASVVARVITSAFATAITVAALAVIYLAPGIRVH